MVACATELSEQAGTIADDTAGPGSEFDDAGARDSV